MVENKKAPKIRFVGFTDAWEKRKLGEVATAITRTDSESTAPVMMISAASGFINQSDKYSSDNAGQSLEKYILLKKGELAYNHGASKYRQYGSCFDLKVDEARIPFVYHCFEVGNNNSDFIARELNDPRIDTQLRRLVSSGARMDGLLNISFEAYKTLTISLPQNDEQDKISAFFLMLDNLITLHQRKYNKLVVMKKSMLEKMFPKNGSNVPEIRFAGFTDAWEQHKLGAVCTINGRIGFRGYTQKDIIAKEEGGILTFSPTNIVDNKLTLDVRNTYITEAKYNESPEIKITNGDILFVKTGSTLGKSALVSGLEEPASINPQIVVLRTDENQRQLILAELATKGIQSQVLAVKIGGAIPTMTETKLKEVELYLPRSLDESKKIGGYFQQLDNLITLYQRKLEKLKKIKKAMLEKMFV
ncbi:MAG: hsdS4 [Anaerocolumna sp.]|jgi:type I restriction enzyme S subunit|nr:hsdS4 [Anaerocolumna sp.]